MKSFAERNPVVVGAIGVALTGVVVLVALNYNNLPFVNSQKQYSAYFSEAGGLAPGAAVQVSGYEVGSVSSVSLEGSHVLVEFEVDDSARLGDRTEAAVKTKSLLGSRILEVVPRGVMAAGAIVGGARGGIDIPSDEADRVKSHLARYYKKMGDTAPWERD